jgi:hypothetical protein
VGRKQAVLVSALMSLVLVTGAACGSDRNGGLTGDPTTLVHAAPERTDSVGTAQVDIGVNVASARGGLAGTGIVDFADGRGDMSFERTGADAHTGAHYRLIVDGGTGYLSGTGLPLTGGRSWLSGPLPDVAEAAAHDVAPLDSLIVRPGAGLALSLLRGATRVLPYGGEEVEGANALRYSFLVDLSLAEAAASPAERPALAAAARFIGPIRFPGDVWLDSQGRVRRVQFATNPRAESTTTQPSFFPKDGIYISFIVIDFTKFGTAAAVRLPDAASVQSVSAPF